MSDTSTASFRNPGLAAIVFDWGGTLIDHGSRAPVRAMMEVLKQFDIDATEAQAREPMGKAKRDHITAMLAMEPLQQQWRRKHGKPSTEADIDAIYSRFQTVQMKCLKDLSISIQGAAETIAACRRRGLRIGSSTGYTREMMAVVLSEAKTQGIEVDAMFCASDVSPGRPAPWLIYENMRALNVYPPSAVVKVDDTIAGIEAGRNAGAWTVGIAATGNEVGLSAEDCAALSRDDRRVKVQAARQRLLDAGAHEVIDSVADLLPVLDAFESRLCSSAQA